MYNLLTFLYRLKTTEAVVTFALFVLFFKAKA